MYNRGRQYVHFNFRSIGLGNVLYDLYIYVCVVLIPHIVFNRVLYRHASLYNLPTALYVYKIKYFNLTFDYLISQQWLSWFQTYHVVADYSRETLLLRGLILNLVDTFMMVLSMSDWLVVMLFRPSPYVAGSLRASHHRWTCLHSLQGFCLGDFWRGSS